MPDIWEVLDMENCYLRRAKGEKKAILSLVSQGQGKFAEGSMLLCFPGQWQHPPPTYTSILEFTGQASLPTFELESDVQKVVMYGHQDHVLYQEKSKDPPLPRAALFRGPWICWTTNVWLLTRFPPPQISKETFFINPSTRALLWRARKQATNWRKLDTLFLCLCGGRNKRFWFKTSLQHPQ